MMIHEQGHGDLLWGSEPPNIARMLEPSYVN
jgi:hypothetical protein